MPRWTWSICAVASSVVNRVWSAGGGVPTRSRDSASAAANPSANTGMGTGESACATMWRMKIGPANRLAPSIGGSILPTFQPPIVVPSSAIAASRSEEHTSELQSLMRNPYAVLCLKKKNSYATVHVQKDTKETKQTHQ